MNFIKPAQKPRSHGFDTAFKMGLLFLMYISQKVFLTFSWTLLPIVLRRQGASLGTIGFIALVYSPWALKFVYASLIDRFYSTKMGKRKSWIVPLLCISWVILPLLAMLPPGENLPLVLSLVFVLNFLFATIDIAVDGYATDILTPEERPWGNTIQMIGYMLGYMLGAGVFLVVYQYLGWKHTVFIITALQLILMLPVLLHRELAPVTNALKDSEKAIIKPSIWPILRQAKALWFLLFLMIITFFEKGGSQLRLPMFVDLGLHPRDLGHLNIWVGTPISILGSILGGYLLHRLGARRVYIAGCLGAAAVSFLTALISQNTSPSLGQVGALIGLNKLAIGVMMVLTCSMTMTMSVGSQAATNYAVLSSVSHLVGFIIMPFFGYICDSVGYFNLFSALAVTGILGIFAGDYLLRKRLSYTDY